MDKSAYTVIIFCLNELTQRLLKVISFFHMDSCSAVLTVAPEEVFLRTLSRHGQE